MADYEFTLVNAPPGSSGHLFSWSTQGMPEQVRRGHGPVRIGDGIPGQNLFVTHFFTDQTEGPSAPREGLFASLPSVGGVYVFDWSRGEIRAFSSVLPAPRRKRYLLPWLFAGGLVLGAVLLARRGGR